MTVRVPIFILAAAFCTSNACLSVTPESGAAGTYEIIICKGSCSFSETKNAFVKGIVVLDDHRLQLRDERLPEPSFAGPNEIAGACFSTIVLRKADSFAALKSRGSSSWKSHGEEISFSMFRSPDAGYQVSVKLAGSGFEGIGNSWGAGVAAPHYSSDVIVGKRVGPPDIKRCVVPPENGGQ